VSVPVLNPPNGVNQRGRAAVKRQGKAKFMPFSICPCHTKFIFTELKVGSGASLSTNQDQALGGVFHGFVQAVQTASLKV
jgi:hypothetical protein